MPSPKHQHYAHVSGSPGTQARFVGIFRGLTPVVSVLILAGICLGLALPVPRIPEPYNAFLLLICAAGMIATMRWGRMCIQNYLLGAQGEELAGRALSLLPPEYRVYHGISMGLTRDLDHVVCGPSGIWVVETTTREGIVSVRGNALLQEGEPMAYSPLDKVLRSAEMLYKALRQRAEVAPEIRSVVCLVGGRLFPNPTQVGGVIVTTPESIREALMSSAEPLSEGILARSVDALNQMVRGE